MLKHKYTRRVLLSILIISVLFVCGVLIGTIQKVNMNTPEVIFNPPVVNETEPPVIQKSSSPTFSHKRSVGSDIVASPKVVVSQADNSEDEFSGLDNLSSLSLKELLPHLEHMTPQMLRDLGENASWFGKRIEDEMRLLSTEEYILMETLHRKAYEGQIERDYEAHFGYPMPPPGYISINTDDGGRETIKINTPYARIKYAKTEGYGKFDNLSESEWSRYLLLTAITNSEHDTESDIEVSRAVLERAREMRKPLYEKSWGTHSTPVVSIVSYYTRDKTEADQALADQLRTEKHAELDAETGQSSRQSSNHNYAYHRDDVLTLIREIESDINEK